MSCARTNAIPSEPPVSSNGTTEKPSESATVMMVNPPRKSATMLETLLQAPMSSRLEDIAADCMRGDGVRTVKVVGDAEVKRPTTVGDDFLNSSNTDTLMDDVSTEVIMDLRVIGSEVKQLQWDSEHLVDNQGSSSLDDSYIQSTLNHCYGNFRDYSTSSDHDHQYRNNSMMETYSDSERKSIMNSSCQQDSSEIESIMESLANQSRDDSIEIHHNPIKRQLSEIADYSHMSFSTIDDSGKQVYIEVGNFAGEAEQNGDAHVNGDYYSDGVNQDSYYLDKNDQMSPRTYNSIFNEYLMSEMGGHEVDYSNYGSSSSKKHQQDSSGPILSNQNTFLDAVGSGVQNLDTDGSMNLNQDLLRNVIQDNIGQGDYPVLSLGGSVISDSEFDPITSALTLNFPNYGSLGLSPPHVQEVVQHSENPERIKHSGTKASKRSLRWERSVSHPTQITPKPTAMLCFMCNWIGKVASIENHLHRSHYKQIIQTDGGVVTLEVNLQSLVSGAYPTKEVAVIAHRDRLYLVRFKFTDPNIFSCFVWAIPPQGVPNPNETPVVCIIQVTDQSNGETKNWRGCIDNFHFHLSTMPKGDTGSKNTLGGTTKNMVMHLRDGSCIDLTTGEERKLLVDIMIQTYKDVLEIELASVKDLSFT